MTHSRLPLTAVLTLVLAVASAAPPARGQAPDKSPSLFPKGYPDHAALASALKAAAEARPDRVRVSELARSSQGREVWLVTLGAPASKASPKPAILVVANLEADHVVGSLLALELIQSVADPKADSTWLDRATVYIVPRLNPDGAERVVAHAPAVEFRTNLRPIDRDRDGKTGEDPPDDLNADGVVTRMRVFDPKTATLVPHEKDPRRSRSADPTKGERALFTEEPEGRDDDGDGLRNEDPPGGVNLNRNWPFRWTEFDREAGFSPASEPEVFSLIKFAFDHPEIATVWSFGLNDNLRDAPKKPESTLDDADLPLVAALSTAFGKSVPARPVGTPAPGATTDGSLADWAYHQFGTLGLASRLWVGPELVKPDKDEKKEEKNDEKKKDEKDKSADTSIPSDGEARWLYWNDRVMNGRAFVPFQAFTHPTLGKVEIGGWRPGVRLNPPSEDVAALASSHLSFLKELMTRLPRLALADAKAVSRGGGLFEVSVAVVNEGFLPTALAQGVRTRKAPPVLLRLDVSKVKLLTGRALERIDFLPGSGARRSFRWLIQAPDGIKSLHIEATCAKAGKVEDVLKLE